MIFITLHISNKTLCKQYRQLGHNDKIREHIRQWLKFAAKLLLRLHMDFKYMATAYWTSGKTGSALVTTSGDMTHTVKSIIHPLCVLASVGWNLAVTYIQ